MADRLPGNMGDILSKVAKRGSAHFKGKVVLPLEGASTPGVHRCNRSLDCAANHIGADRAC